MENTASAFGKTTRYSPTEPAWPLSAAITRGVLPLWSTESTFPPLASRSCRQSTWSLKAAAWTGVLQLTISDIREIFNWKSSGIAWILLYFALIGLENSRHSLNQSNAKPKPITTRSPALYRAFCSCVGFTLTSHWLLNVFSFLLIGRCYCFGLGFHSIEKRSKSRQHASSKRVFWIWLTLSKDINTQMKQSTNHG